MNTVRPGKSGFSAQQPLLLPLPGGEVVLRLRFGNAQFQGERAQQQDAFGFSPLSPPDRVARSGFLAVLADGMGGLAGGREASARAVELMLSQFGQPSYALERPEQLNALVTAVNRQICQADAGKGSRGGTTLVAAWFRQTRLYWACVGDSRLYLWRAGSLYQCNEDHNLTTELLTGCIHKKVGLDDVRRNPNGQALTSFLGHPGLPKVDWNPVGFNIQSGDKYLLCTDGVYQALPASIIAEAMRRAPQQAADALIQAVRRRRHPGQDNATALIIEYMPPLNNDQCHMTLVMKHSEK